MATTRRRSMMPAINRPVRKEDLPLPIPVATTAASRRKSMAPPAVRPLPPASGPAKRVRALPAAASKATASSKAKAQTKKSADFVSAEAFDFGLPDDFEEAAVPSGPMTRSRRTSVYAKKGAALPVDSKKPTAARATKRPSKAAAAAKADKVIIEEENAAAAALITNPVAEEGTETVNKTVAADAAAPLMTSTVVKAKKAVPEIKIAEPLTPIVELQRMESNEYKTSNDRRKTVRKSGKKMMTNLKVAQIDNAATPPLPQSSMPNMPGLEEQGAPTNVLSAIPLNMTPAKSTRKASKQNQKPALFMCTPQAVDPVRLLKKNLKQKVEKDLDAKVAGLPQQSSPYVLINSETENGSPVQEFVKLQNGQQQEEEEKQQKIRSNFVTGTPAPAKANKRREVLAPLRLSDGSPELPPVAKRGRRAADADNQLADENQTPVASKPTPKRRSNILNKSVELAENLDEKTTPSGGGSWLQARSPIKNTSHLVTGDLVKACCIM